MRIPSSRASAAFALAAVGIVFGSAPSAWSKEICSVPKAQWKPQGALTQKLESQGWKIRNLKIDSGCYEVYGTDSSGKARETHFNPQTLQPAAEEHKNY
ncbi:MAG: PepSY domain-containing protein [Hyphomicrobium sp.]|nr:PepSY domain-containing protein [Hyphomicrobium sp.]